MPHNDEGPVLSEANLATDDPRLERDAADLYAALSDLIRVYQFRDRDRICCHDLSVTQCYALEALATRGPLTMNQLAARLYLDKSTVSRVVDTVQRKGLLERRTHPDDKRAVLLECTEKGRALHERIAGELKDREMRMLADFDPDVRVAMIELVGRLARAAANRVDTSGGTCCCTDC